MDRNLHATKAWLTWKDGETSLPIFHPEKL
jgi:hypothetical protein